MAFSIGILSAASSSRVYATLDPVRKSPNVTVTGSNLTGNGTTTAVGVGIATIGKSSGKWYWEATVNNCNQTTYGKIGVTNILMVPPYNLPNSLGGGGTSGTGTVGYWGSGAANGTTKASYNFAGSSVLVNGNGGQIVNGDVLSVALDLSTNNVSFYRNGTLACTIALSASTWYPAFATTAINPVTSVTFNFGQNAWSATTAGIRATLFASGYTIGLY
jgi:hypothetical protein